MGEYTLLMMKSITLPDRWSMFFKQLIKEIYKLGVDSLWIVIIISVFIGTVIAIQISLNISSPLIPKFTIGYTTREIILLEFSYSGIGYLQYVHRYHGRHIRQLLNEYGNDSFLVRVRFTILLQRVLHLVFYYQIRSICVHHLIHRRLFWL